MPPPPSTLQNLTETNLVDAAFASGLAFTLVNGSPPQPPCNPKRAHSPPVVSLYLTLCPATYPIKLKPRVKRIGLAAAPCSSEWSCSCWFLCLTCRATVTLTKSGGKGKIRIFSWHAAREWCRHFMDYSLYPFTFPPRDKTQPDLMIENNDPSPCQKIFVGGVQLWQF